MVHCIWIQDKYEQKNHFASKGISVAQSHDVSSKDELKELLSRVGPLVLKKKRFVQQKLPVGFPPNCLNIPF